MSGMTLGQIMTVFLAIGGRLSGLLLFAPFYGSEAIPPRIKAGLVFAISVLLFPVLAPVLQQQNTGTWPGFLLKELVVGAGIGIATRLVFDAMQMAGQVLSTQMGFSLVNILDPQTQVDSTVMALFHQTVTLLIFLRLDVHLWLLRALGHSYVVLPPGTAHISRLFTTTAVQAGGEVFVMGLQIAAPVLSATFLADIVLGLLGRASPQLPLMLLGTPLKTLLGLSLLFVALKYWPGMLERFFLQSGELSNRLLLEAR